MKHIYAITALLLLARLAAGFTYTSEADYNSVNNCLKNIQQCAAGSPAPTPASTPPIQDGDTLKLRGGTFAYPATGGVTVTKDIQIIGNGATGPNATVLSGNSFIFKLQPHGTSNTMRLSGMTLTDTQATSGLGNAPLVVDGYAVVDDTVTPATGGIRIDHIVFNGLHVNTAATTMSFAGWPEGVVDHCVVDQVLDPADPHGESFIINFNTSPKGKNPSPALDGSTLWEWGDYSIWKPYSLAGPHQLYFEDNIFKRGGGGTDSHNTALSGGARWTYRHNTSWGQDGGHGFRESNPDGTQGCRAKEDYKNLFIRNLKTFTSTNVRGAQFTIWRSGEGVCFGNRYHREGETVKSYIENVLQTYAYGTWCTSGGSRFGPADGRGVFDENYKGSFTAGGNSYVPDGGAQPSAGDPAGDIYLRGNGTGTASAQCVNGSGASAPCTSSSNVKIDKVAFKVDGVTSAPDDWWTNFVLINTVTRRGSITPISWGIITSSSGNTLTVHGSTINASSHFDIQPGQGWEIRRVKSYYGATGMGSILIPMNSAETGPYEDTTPVPGNGAGQQNGAMLLNPTPASPNPRWAGVASSPGMWQWDNQTTSSIVSPPTPTYSPITLWGSALIYEFAIPGGTHVGTPKPGYPYNGATAAGSAPPGSTPGTSPETRPNTRVGADWETWVLGNATGSFPPPNTNVKEYTSLYASGDGGYTYPHPLIKPAAVTPQFDSDDECTFRNNVGAQVQTYQVKTSGWSAGGTVTYGITWSGSAPTSPSNVSFTSGGLFTGSGSGATTKDYTGSITATHAPDTAPTPQAFTLHMKANASPSPVAITSPSPSQVFRPAPANIVVQATAQDDTGLSMIEFLRGGTVWNTINSPLPPQPFSATDSNVAVGSYDYTVRVTDNFGAQATSSPAVSVSVATPTPTPTPTPGSVSATITAPSNNASYDINPPATTSNVTVEATGNGSSLNKVEFYRAPSPMPSPTPTPFSTMTPPLSAQPFTATDSNVPLGSYIYNVKIYNSSTSGVSSPVNVKVQQVGGTPTPVPSPANIYIK